MGGVVLLASRKNSVKNKPNFSAAAATSFPISTEIVSEPILRENDAFYLFMKRAFDLVVSGLALIVLIIPFILIAIIIRLDSEGPAFFTQERLGMNGKPFKIIKFRSMVKDAEKHGAMWAKKNDSRVTRVGRFLRNSRIDELPQLINIFTGNMSFVGPRPERQIFYDKFDRDIPHFKYRLKVKPGLTGWAQIHGGYELKPEEKIIFDLEYIERRSFWLDIKCIFMTLPLAVNHKGAR